jgi:HK97 family phage major capsid protein
MVPSGLVQYPVETFPVGTGSFGYQSTQGASKAELDYAVTTATLTIDFLAGFSRVSRQLLQDLPQLEAYLSRSLTEDFESKLDDLIYNALVAANPLNPSTSETLPGSKLIDYITAVENVGHTPNFIGCNPLAWAKLLKSKPDNSGYSLPGGTAIDENGNSVICGLPVVKIATLPANTVVIGDFFHCSALAATDLFNVRVFDQDSDNATKNLITFRAEQRVAPMFFAPRGFAIGTI